MPPNVIPLPAREEKKVVVKRAGGGVAGGRFNFDRVTRFDLIAYPVGYKPLRGALSGDAERFSEQRAARERIAAKQVALVVRDAQR